ncbi:InlB B-repeat-containing protein [Tissierella praeacuta]|uniref:InlB B-repeat-containing protein n=1 Tax=Tissierella praeacuta TaxID=43131 RepID=UPI00333FDED7
MKNFIKRVLIFALVFINMMNINAVFAETEKINLTIRAVVNDKKIDELINAGMVVVKDGEEVLENNVEVKPGTTITIRAVDGNKSFFKEWKRPTGVNNQEFINLFGASNKTPELTFMVTEEFKTRNIKTIEASYNHFIEIDPSGTDFGKGTVDIEVTGKGTGLYSTKNGYPLGQNNDRVKFKADAKSGYEFEKWEFIWAMPIIGLGAASNKDVKETDAEIEIILPAIPKLSSFPQNYLPVIAHFKVSEKQGYRISFNTNGGSAIEEQLIDEGEKAVKPADPTKEGYKFIDWYIDEALENVFNFDTAISDDITLYAKWKEELIKKYTVTFNANGGNNIASIEVEEGRKLTKPTNPMKEGYKFISWYEDSSLTKEFNFNTEITKDLTLYAKWEKESAKEYNINFNTNGGSSINSKKVTVGEKVDRPSDPTKSENKFMGWYEDLNLTEEFSFDTPITKDITLYAKWKDNNKALNPSDYITNIKIPISPKSPDINTVFFHKYELEDDKILLYIGKDSSSWKDPTYNAFLGFTDPSNGISRLMNNRLVIETTGIKEIKVDNFAKDEIINLDNGNTLEYMSIKNFKEDADTWSQGIWFNNFGNKVITKDKEGNITREINTSRFDKDNPPEFTFITNDGDKFQLTWEVIKVKADMEEERIELTVKASATTYNIYDPEVKAGILQGNELIGYKELKKEDRVRIKAEDGNKSFFTRWKIWRTEDIDIDNKLNILLGEDITSREIEFDIGDYAFELAKNYKIKIEALYKTYTIIDTTQTSSKEGNVDILVFDTGLNERKDFNSKDGFPLADTKDIIELRAIPEAGYVFNRWEFITPGVAGTGTKNPNVNLNSPVIQIELPEMISGGDPEKNYNLRLKAVFSENTKNIEEILDMEDEEFIQGYDKYQLPSTVKVRYSDGSEGFEIINWDRSIEVAILGENVFIGSVAGTDKTTELKVIIKKIIDIKEEYKIQEVMVYNNDFFGVGMDYYLPTTVSVRLNDNTERTINIEKWEGTNVLGGINGKYRISYYQHGTYKAKGTIKGFDDKIELTLNVERELEKSKLKVEFDPKGGSLIPAQEVKQGETVSRPADPTKEGYKFIGWYEDLELTRVFNFDTPITKDITLHAKWEEEPLQEILEIKSVELTKDGQTISKGIIKDKEITLELPEGFDEIINQGKYMLKITGTEGTRITQDKGHDAPIEEWTAGVSNSIMPGQSVKFVISKGDNFVEYIIKIVEPTVKKYTVTFNTNGGNNIASIEVEEGQKLTKQSNPTKEGYKFIGWYEDSSLTKEFNFNTEITNDLTVYVKWEKELAKEYTVIFNTDGGNSINSKKLTVGEKVSRPSDPTKEGHKFIGWYEDSNLTKVFNFNTPITKDITLYAKWEKAEKSEPEKPVEKKDAKILSFKLLGIEGSINHSTGKIYVDLPYRTSLRNLTPVITYSEGATISPDMGVAKDFDRIVRYIVSGNDFNPKTYEVDVSMPKEKEYEEIINRDPDWYRDRRRSRRDEKDWYEITQEIKKERLKEEERKTRSEIRDEALEEVRKITAQSENIRRDLSFTQFSNYMEVRLNIIGMNDLYKNKINIPAGVLKNLKELEFDYLKYNTGSLGIRIYPAMDSPDGVYINIKPAPNEPYNNIQSAWSKIKGAGRLFEIEANSTKAGLSIEMRLEKFLPAEYIRVVKYNYMKRQFEDLEPEKWSIIDGYIHMQQVSGGIYGVIYKG